MQPLKTIRKQKYPYAKDFLPILAEHGVKYSIPEYSLFESGRALPTKANAVTICRCLGCDMGEVEEFIAFGEKPTIQAKSARRTVIPGRGMYFDELPEGNPKRSAGRWSNGDWLKLQSVLNQWGYSGVKQYFQKAVLDTLPK